MAQQIATVQNITKFFKSLGISDKEDKKGYFIGPKSAAGKEFIIFLPERNRNNVQYTKKTRTDFLKEELLPTLMNFKGAKYELVPKNSTAGQISFQSSSLYIIPKLISMKGTGASKGVAFEGDMEKDFKSLINGTNKFKYPKFIEEFQKDYVGNNDAITEVKITGGENTKRPLKFQAGQLYCSLRGGAKTSNIGEGLADLKVMTRNGKTFNLSAKFGKTVTFFNSGIGRVVFPPDGAFPEDEFKSGQFKDKRGKAILDLFGLDPQKFRDVFEKYVEKSGVIKKRKAPKEIVNVPLSSAKKTELQEFLKTVIGHGFLLVHLDDKGHVHHYEMTKSRLDKASKITTDLSIEYPMEGSAKRIDIKVETELYKLNFNIRSKAAGVTKPTHIMCDYELKH